MKKKPKLSAKERKIKMLFARAEALQECSDHLLMSWTDDETEYGEGKKLSKKLQKMADRWRDKAIDLQVNNEAKKALSLSLNIQSPHQRLL